MKSKQGREGFPEEAARAAMSDFTKLCKMLWEEVDKEFPNMGEESKLKVFAAMTPVLGGLMSSAFE